MKSDDPGIEDWWYHRNKQLDHIDQPAATERTCEQEQLWTSRSSLPDDGARQSTGPPKTVSQRHREAIEQLASIAYSTEARQWEDRLRRIDPVQLGAGRRLDALAGEMRDFLARVTDWGLGHGSLGTGMTIRDGLELARSMVAVLAIDAKLDAPRLDLTFRPHAD